MKLRLVDDKLIALRAIGAAGFICAFLFTLVLSATPQLHERIHQAAATANHQCAVTLLTSGSCEHAAYAAVATAPNPAPSTPTFSYDGTQFVSARAEFSLLEHAPPAIS